MRKKFLTQKLIGVIVGVILLGVLFFQVSRVNAETAGVLDHVQITPPNAALLANGTQQFTAQGFDSDNAAIPNLNYSWTVIAGGGTINNGLFTAGNITGTYTNTVEVIVFQGNITLAAFATVNVYPNLGSLDHLLITPSSATLAIGGVQQFSAQGYDLNNIAIPNLAYTWSVLSGGGNISATGLFTAVTPGIFTNTIQVQTIQGNIIKTALASVTISASPGPLDHVLITPSSASVITGGTLQFGAQAYDSGNTAIPNLTYQWSVIQGGGTLNDAGLFLAGNVPGTYNNTVQVIVVQGNITRANFASVKVTAAPVTSSASSALTTDRLLAMVNSSLKNVGFSNLLSAQWIVKQDSGTVTVNIVPGIVTQLSNNSLTLQPNGQPQTAVFDISSAIIRPNGTQLQLNDRIVVVSINGQVNIVLKVNSISISPNISNRLPPGLAKKANPRNGNDHQPPGWSKGNKTGWGKNGPISSDQGDED